MDVCCSVAQLCCLGTTLDGLAKGTGMCGVCATACTRHLFRKTLHRIGIACSGWQSGDGSALEGEISWEGAFCYRTRIVRVTVAPLVCALSLLDDHAQVSYPRHSRVTGGD